MDFVDVLLEECLEHLLLCILAGESTSVLVLLVLLSPSELKIKTI